MMSHNYLEIGGHEKEVLVGVKAKKRKCHVAWDVGPFSTEKLIISLEWLRVHKYNFVFSVEAGKKRWLQKDDCFAVLLENQPDGETQCCVKPDHHACIAGEVAADSYHAVGFHLMCECNGIWYSCHQGQSGSCCP